MKTLRLCLALLVLGLLVNQPALAQKPRQEGRIAGRIVGTAAGVVGGFFLGWAISDDDAVNAERLLGRNIAISAAALGAAGFLAGRAIDKRSSWQRPMDSAEKRRIQTRIVETEVKRLTAAGWADEASIPGP